MLCFVVKYNILNPTMILLKLLFARQTVIQHSKRKRLYISIDHGN